MLLVCGCGTGTGADRAIAPVAPPPIEASEVRADKLLGVGDKTAERCFAALGAARGRGACAAGDDAACAARCRHGDVAACDALATRLASDPSSAPCGAKLRELACDHGALPSCAALADQIGTGISPASYPDRWDALMSRACDGGHGRACTRLGYHWLQGHREPAHTVKDGLMLMERACDIGDADGCRYAADAYENVAANPLANREKARELRGKACELADHESCVDLARQLVTKPASADDTKQGRQILEKVCRLEDSSDRGAACFELAQIGGPGSSLDALLDRACAKGHYDACARIAREHYHEQRYREAVTLATELVDKDGDHWLPRQVRGLSLFDLGRHQEAMIDLGRVCELRADWLQCPLMLFAARARSGQDGSPALAETSKSMKLDEWPGPVVAFYLGKLREPELLAKAKHADAHKEKEQLCEAYYYLGQHELIRGKKDRARELFEKSVATGITSFTEHRGARAELGRLNANP